MIYHEQVMQIAQVLAGYSLVSADDHAGRTLIRPVHSVDSDLGRDLELLKAEREWIQTLGRDTASFGKTGGGSRGAVSDHHWQQLQQILQRLAEIKQASRSKAVEHVDRSTPAQNRQTGNSNSTSTAGEALPRTTQTAGHTANPPADHFTQPVEIGKALYRAGNYEAAEKAFRIIDQTILSVEDRLPIQYMIATCLRKQGRRQQAASIYHDIANSNRDDVLMDYARWQLDSINWRQKTENQIERLKQLRTN